MPGQHATPEDLNALAARVAALESRASTIDVNMLEALEAIRESDAALLALDDADIALADRVRALEGTPDPAIAHAELSDRIAALEAIHVTPDPDPDPDPIPDPVPVPDPDPDPPPSGGDVNAYFVSLRDRPDRLVAYSLRDPQQLRDHAHRSDGVSSWTFDPAVNAARIDWPANTNSKQVRLPIGWNGAGGSLFVTWEARFGPSFQANRGGLHTSKTFQFSRPNAKLWVEVRNRYGGHALPDISAVDVRPYGGLGAGASAGSGGRLEPMQPFIVLADRWVRYFARFRVAGSAWRWSLWVADADSLVQIHDDVALSPPSGGVDLFWLEYNSSQETHGEMIGWVRNIVALQGVDDVGPLLVQPVG